MNDMNFIEPLDRMLASQAEELRECYTKISKREDSEERGQSSRIEIKTIGGNLKTVLDRIQDLLGKTADLPPQKKGFSVDLLNQTQAILQEMEEYLNLDDKIVAVQMQILGAANIPRNQLLSQITKLMRTISKLKETRGKKASKIEGMQAG